MAIVSFDDLMSLRKQVAMVDGGFDPLHLGHIEYFKAATRLGFPLLCCLASDRYVGAKHKPLLPQNYRAGVIDAIRYIDYVCINEWTTAEVLRQLQPRYYVKGKDWENRLPPAETAACEEYGIELIYLDTVLDSSSRILKDYLTSKRINMDITSFECFVIGQKPVSPDQYDDEYFNKDWRSEGNSYAIETRRSIEGRNPALIKEVFAPKRVLDMGCGPGALMYFLTELGVDCEGIDASPHIREMAPPEVRDHITVASAMASGKPDNSYDLVISREVLEHLTVLEVRRAVTEMCRVTSRFIYLTTRFHSKPVSLLDVTNEFHVDPTHITCLNKDFLRVLFVLEGCRSRPDLEAQMDWLNKGRVMVFEKLGVHA